MPENYYTNRIIASIRAKYSESALKELDDIENAPCEICGKNVLSDIHNMDQYQQCLCFECYCCQLEIGNIE